MNFGVPSQRRKGKAEKFPGKPVLTLGIDGGVGTSRKMFLNKAAVERLGLPDEGAVIAFTFDMNETKTECIGVNICNANNANIPDYAKIRVTKNNPRSISEKKTYEYISTKAFQLDNSVENHFQLFDSPVITEEGLPVLSNLQLITEGSTTTDEVNETAQAFEPQTDGIEAVEEEVENSPFEATSVI